MLLYCEFDILEMHDLPYFSLQFPSRYDLKCLRDVNQPTNKQSKDIYGDR